MRALMCGGGGGAPRKTAGTRGHRTRLDARHQPVRTNPPRSPRGSQDRRFSFSPGRQPVCRIARRLLQFFFLNDNFPPFFVAKNHPGLSRREGRKLCREREGKIISPGHRRRHLSSACSERSGEGMKMKAGPDPSLSSPALPGGGPTWGGRAGGAGAVGSHQGAG